MVDYSVTRDKLYESEVSKRLSDLFWQCMPRKVLLHRRSGVFYFAQSRQVT